MKILSNFDTGRAALLLEQAEASFGEGNAVLIRKSNLYFYQFIGMPIFGYLILFILGAYAVMMTPEVPVEAQRGFLIIMVLIAFMMSFKLSKRRIDYRMDYLLITPKEVTKYDQGGVFNRDVENIPVDKVKSISISKHGILQSMFDIGSIIFLAEGDTDEGDIVMDYIDAVGYTEKRIKQVIGTLSKTV